MFYYDSNIAGTSHATINTEVAHQFLLSGATMPAFLVGLYLAGRMVSAGGLVMRTKKFPTTAPSGGTAVTMEKRDPDAPTALVTAGTASYTVGTGTPKVRQIVGCAAQGGFGGWFAPVLEQAYKMKAAGGVNGHLEFYSTCPLASVLFDFGTEVVEV